MSAAAAGFADVDLIVSPMAFGRAGAATVCEVDVAGAPVLVVVETGVQGRDGQKGEQGIPGASGAGGSSLATYTAAAVVSGDKAVMFAGPGKIVPADPTAAGYVYAGIALGAAQPGSPVEVQSQGDVQASFWTWSANLPVFTAPGGNLTQTPPTSGRSHLIGWALDAQTIHLDPEPPISIQ